MFIKPVLKPTCSVLKILKYIPPRALYKYYSLNNFIDYLISLTYLQSRQGNLHNNILMISIWTSDSIQFPKKKFLRLLIWTADMM